MGFSVGIGLTNACNLACPHCYRDLDRVDELTVADIKMICDSIPVKAVNLGTGENALNPQFSDILAYLAERGIPTTITSNGFSISALSDEQVKLFRDVEFSLDFPSEAEQDSFRGPGNWRLVLDQIARCRRLEVNVTVAAVMMSTNYLKLGQLARMVADVGAALRVNVFQSVNTHAFSLSYEQFWDGFRGLFAETELIACNEPIVRAVLGLAGKRCGCGIGTVRVTPRGSVLPCVYWPDRRLTLSDLGRLGESVADAAPFEESRLLPEFCRSCEFAETCGGGCAGRRILKGRLDQPDEYCPFFRGEPMGLQARVAGSREMHKAASACTTIVRALGPAE